MLESPRSQIDCPPISSFLHFNAQLPLISSPSPKKIPQKNLPSDLSRMSSPSVSFVRAPIVRDNKRERQRERKIGREREKREKTRASARQENQMNPPRGRQSQTGSYLLCSAAGASSTWACVFCRRRRGMPPLFFGARLGHIAGCTRWMQSVWAFALQPRHLTPWRLCPRSTWPQASQGVIFR